MFELFPNWMNKVVGTSAGSRIQDRWNAVEKLAKAALPKQIVDLVAHAFGYSTSMTDVVRGHAREADPNYVTEDDALEVQILVAGAIASLLTGSSSHRGVAALAIVSTTFGRDIPDFMCKDLAALASQQLQKAAEEARAWVPLPVWNTKPLVESLGKLMPVPPESGITGTAVLSAVTTVVEVVKAQMTKQAAAADMLANLQKESAALAFQVVSEYSGRGQRLLSESSLGDAAVGTALDLYDTTSRQPVLPSYEAIISSILRPVKNVKKPAPLESIVSSMTDPIRVACTYSGQVMPLAQPLHYGLQKQAEMSSGDWRPAFVQGSKLKADLQVAPVVFSRQMYVERCLLWALGDA